MSLKKIKEKNQGFEFSSKATKKASDPVKRASLKTKLNMGGYNVKYPDQVSSKKHVSEDAVKKLGSDKKWKFVKKVSANKNIDFLEEPKGSFFDEKGNEMAAED